MRVISGRFKGVALTTPKAGTRPTTDRTKEAIFSHLDSWGVLDDARVLDLFAGTGALGIEALSRGALSAVFVENNRRGADRADSDGTETQPFMGAGHERARDQGARGKIRGFSFGR